MNALPDFGSPDLVGLPCEAIALCVRIHQLMARHGRGGSLDVAGDLESSLAVLVGMPKERLTSALAELVEPTEGRRAIFERDGRTLRTVRSCDVVRDAAVGVPMGSQSSAAKMARELFADGMSYRQISDELANRGHVSRAGTPYAKGSISKWVGSAVAVSDSAVAECNPSQPQTATPNATPSQPQTATPPQPPVSLDLSEDLSEKQLLRGDLQSEEKRAGEAQPQTAQPQTATPNGNPSQPATATTNATTATATATATATSKRPKRTTTRLPTDFAPTDASIAALAADGIHSPLACLAGFVDYWTSGNAKNGGLKADWQNTFRNWCRGNRSQCANPGARITADWKPAAETIATLKAEGFQDPINCARAFVNHFLSLAGEKGTRADWDRAFAVWVHNEAKFNGQKAGPGPDPKAVLLDMVRTRDVAMAEQAKQAETDKELSAQREQVREYMRRKKMEGPAQRALPHTGAAE